MAEHKSQKWRALDNSLTEAIKQSALASLGTEPYNPSSAAQVVSSIALIEIPLNSWPDIMAQLCEATKTAPSDAHRIAFLETIGYICEDLQPTLLEKDSNNILTVIVNGMKSAEPNPRVKLAAVTALRNTLDACRSNFERPDERNFIMQVTCELTQSPDPKLVSKAFECLVHSVTLYYDFMDAYVPTFYTLAIQAMQSQSQESDVVLQAIELCTTIAEEEMNMFNTEYETQEAQSKVKGFTRLGVATVVPVLLQLLAKQEDDDDDDDWTISKAAAVCLNNIGKIAGNDMLPIVVPFVSNNVQNTVWQFRDAAIMAFCSVIDGSSPEHITTLVRSALSHIIGMMNDPVANVKDSVAWLLSNMIEVLPDVVLGPEYSTALLQSLVAGMDMEPRVAANCCWAMKAVAEKLREKHEEESEGEPQTWMLSQPFEQLITHMFKITERDDGAQHKLRFAAYDALGSLLRYSALDCYPVVRNALVRALQTLQQSTTIQAQSKEMLESIGDTQTLLCSLLEAILPKIQEDHVPLVADNIAQVLLVTMQYARTNGLRDVSEESLLTLSVFFSIVKANGFKYVEAFNPFIIAALGEFADYALCQSAVGAVNDVVSHLKSNSSAFVNDYMTALLAALSNPTLDRKVKPHIVSCFADIATALEGNFKPFLQGTLSILAQAAAVAQVRVPDIEDYDAVDAANSLRSSILCAYTSILSVLVSTNDLGELLPHVPTILLFIDNTFGVPEIDEETINNSYGLFGDLCNAYGRNMQPIITPPFTAKLFAPERANMSHKSSELSKYALRELQKVNA